ncbi:MAG: glycosyltransferase family 4 protein [Kiritimatiellae bacterium]|nr:glycosyltransferase family 4 protein [Kiritimatiellia bacterium]
MTARASLHVWHGYGLRSEVWLYRLLQGLRAYPPHLLLREEWIKEEFRHPFPWPSDRLVFLPARPLVLRALGKIPPFLKTGRRDVLSALDARFMRRLCRARGVAVVHIHFAHIAWAFLGATQRLGAPVVVSCYGSDVFRAAGVHGKRLDRLLRTDVCFVVTSNALREELVRRGAPPHGIAVVPVGICADDFPTEAEVERRRTANRAKKTVRLITVGRMIECKAMHQLPQVARILKEAGVAFEWVIVGDGPFFSECQRNIHQLDVADTVTLKGSLPWESVRDLLSESDIMVHNAVVARDGARESLGVSLMEAGAMGLPVVSCRVGGIPEVVADGETGILCEPGDPAGMAESIRLLSRDPERRCRMGLAAMRRVRELFDSRRLAGQLEAVYDGIRAEKG